MKTRKDIIREMRETLLSNVNDNDVLRYFADRLDEIEKFEEAGRDLQQLSGVGVAKKTMPDDGQEKSTTVWQVINGRGEVVLEEEVKKTLDGKTEIRERVPNWNKLEERKDVRFVKIGDGFINPKYVESVHCAEFTKTAIRMLSGYMFYTPEHNVEDVVKLLEGGFDGNNK